MVTFATSSQGVAPTGGRSEIGNQQTVQTGQTSLAGVISSVTDVAAKGIDVTARVLSKDAAEKAVESGKESVERFREDVEELTAIQKADPSVRDVKREADLLSKGVTAGTVKRSTARMLVSNSVKKAIDENPLLSSRIREAAKEFLGFTPESEAARQFFSTFDTESELSAAAASANKPTKRQIAINEIQQGFGTDLATATDIHNQSVKRDVEKAQILDDIAFNNATAEQGFSKLNNLDTGEATIGVFGRMKRLAAEGKEVTPSTWNQVIEEQRSAGWAAMLNNLNATGKGPDTATTTRMESSFNKKYDLLREQVKDFDSTAVREESIARLASIHKVFGARTLPVFTFINNTFGERTGASIMDLIRSANGDTARLSALLSVTPGLEPLVAMLQRDPSEFSKGLESSLRRLDSPTDSLTDSDSPFIDLISTQAVKSPPEEIEKFVDKLFDNNLNLKGVSTLVRAGRSGATSKSVSRMKNEWNTIQGVFPDEIADLIADGGGSVVMTEKGLQFKAKEGDRNRGGVSSDPLVSNKLNKINLMLEAAGKGWGEDLKISNARTTANSMIESINSKTDVIREEQKAIDAKTLATKLRRRELPADKRRREVRGIETGEASIFQEVSTPAFGAGMTDDQKRSRIQELEAKAGGQ